MAGVMVNGCGWADSYYPMKKLGTCYCKSCKKDQPFSLMMLKMKIRVIFIPTIPINTKYAVVCEKCKTGFYVDEATKDRIQSSNITLVSTDDGIQVNYNDGGYVPVQSNQNSSNNIVQQNNAAVAQAKRKINFCPACGTRADEGDIYCLGCGKKL